MVPDSRLPLEASEEDLREYLINGAVFDSILNRLSLESVDQVDNSNFSSESHLESVSRFLEAVYEMGLPKFEVQDLEQGSMKPVLECFWAVKEKFSLTPGEVARSSSIRSPNNGRRSWSLSGAEFDSSPDIFLHQDIVLWGLRMRDGRIHKTQSSSVFCEVMLHQNAPTQSLLSVIRGILDECIEKKNGEIPQRVSILLKKVMLEIERRRATQADHIRSQNNLYKSREDKYQSRIRILEILATGTSEETQIAMNRL
ncbi:hypothetical protein C5167_034563 [Papaver somniferum]|uniref:Calponin-homology (CH) domain-containing protein n=1 Tax=Papaver somniferum TaxID=3469 RepID=A0A4Y7KHF3_PAPSO|nr:hypothetical protein C5167_034563 [Papaver somniferum]